MVENRRPIPAVDIGQRVVERIRENRFVLQNGGKISVARCLLRLAGCQVNVDEAD
jgi:hypothetical protein